MLFTIQRKDGLFFHNNGRIILYESEREAKQFLDRFIEYSVQRLMFEHRSNEAMSVPIIISQECVIIPVEFDIKSVRCGVVYAKDLLRKK